ncbi:Glycosyltransferase sugar-binding region containing DXD motif-containing protein 1 [Elsinoe fawcettii]|nr:Glycosyltransferase sugar-binding region containing DXD motif-containing protein 1 [Elsinoe fawcettii]
MSRRLSWIQLVLAVITFLSLRLTYNQYTFEHFLLSNTISFSSFPPSYSTALRTSGTARFDLTYDFPLAFPSPPSIPPLIHFIWFKDLYNDSSRPSHIPSGGSHGPSKCLEFNPTFTTKIWNATDALALIAQEYEWFLPTYLAYPHPIQRVDAAKYFILHHHGGVYLDMDVACRRDLTPLLQMPAWFPKARPFGVNNDIMAARKGHPVMRTMLENLQRRNVRLGSPYLTIFWSTGPQFTSAMVRKWWWEGGWSVGRWERDASRGKESGNEGSEDAVMILPDMFYSEEFTFFGHSPGGTWYGKDVMVVLGIRDDRMESKKEKEKEGSANKRRLEIYGYGLRDLSIEDTTAHIESLDRATCNIIQVGHLPHDTNPEDSARMSPTAPPPRDEQGTENFSIAINVSYTDYNAEQRLCRKSFAVVILPGDMEQLESHGIRNFPNLDGDASRIARYAYQCCAYKRTMHDTTGYEHTKPAAPISMGIG